MKSNKLKKSQWWQTTFDEKYIATYVDAFTPQDTKKQVSFLVKHLKLEKGDRILDLACGYGRHSIELAKLGYSVTGVDFSKHFIEIAKKEAKKQKVVVEFIQADMRKIPFRNKFDAVINMFTSFGYFEDEKDHLLVLRNIANSLKKNGKFLLELNNFARTLSMVIKEGKTDKKTRLLMSIQKQRLSNGLKVTTKNQIDIKAMRWNMTRVWKEKGRAKSYNTSVRLFSFPELRKLLHESGLEVERVWGGINGSSLVVDSKRLIILARKK